MKAICNVKGCGRSFEIDTKKGGNILCPIGHFHGYLIGSCTEAIEFTDCYFENSVSPDAAGEANQTKENE